jgi:hypothetical protein
MKNQSFPVACILLMAVLFSCSDQTLTNVENLRQGFQSPPQSARPKVYWWWLNGYVDSVRVKEELRAMKDAGISGVDIFEIGVPPNRDPEGLIPAGPAFMSEESLKMIQLAINEAGKLGMEVNLGVASSWNAGGSWVEPIHAAKTLYASKVTIRGHQKVTMKLPFPEITPGRGGEPRKIEYQANGRPVYSEEVAVIAVPSGGKDLADTSNIINVSGFFNTQTEELKWQAPTGTWDVYRYICSNSGEQLIRPSPKSAGPIIDHFDSSATRMHMMYFIDRLKPLIGDFEKSSLKGLYLASYEAKEFTWTPTLPEAFKKLNGYDIYKFIPAIFDAQLFDPKTAEAFNFDFLKTFSELMINNHYGKSKEICNAYGLKITSEAGGPGHMHHIPVETLKALGALDVPRGEFWYNREYFKEDSIVDYIWLVKEIAAASHIYKRGIVEEEAFTSYWDWQESPANLKIIADRAFCEGMNRVVVHGFPHNPSGFGYPGIAYWAGTHYNDKRAWWPKVRPFNDYLARISYILQEASFYSDVLYYYGDKVPNLVPPKNTRFKVGDGYDYEVINTEVLLRELTVEDGELVLPGVGRYKVLSVGNEDAINPDVLLKIKELLAKGAVVVGQKPVRSAGLNHQPQAATRVQSESENIWNTTGTDIREKGKVFSLITPAEALRQLEIPQDLGYDGQTAGALDYIHYKKGEQDFYLLRNTTGDWLNRNIAFRQKGKTPEIWDPGTGNITPLFIFESSETHVRIPLSIPAYGSYFVVFSPGSVAPRFHSVAGQDVNIQYTDDGFYFPRDGRYSLIKDNVSETIASTRETVTLSGEWNLAFPANWGAPAAVKFPSLESWTESRNPGVRYFSGIGTYNKTFDLNFTPDNGDRVFLDLGDLAEVAEVWLNGKSLGITWTKPHRFDVTSIVRKGGNELKVEVANTWSNRLTGDGITGEKFTQTNIAMANKFATEWKDLPLKRSGLFGPVTVEVVPVWK